MTMEHEQLETWWALYLDGEVLDETQLRELSTAMHADAELRRRFLDQRALHGELCEEGRTSTMQRNFSERLGECLQAEKNVSGFMRRLTVKLPRRRSRLRQFMIAASMAAAVLIGVALFTRPDRQLPQISELTGTAQIMHRDTTVSASAGSTVRSGDTLVTGSASRAVVRYTDGTLVTIDERTTARLSSTGGAKRVYVMQGALDADIRPQPSERPMLFSSDDATATVVGTRLSFIAMPGATRLIVHEGSVQFARRHAAPIVVAGGEFAVAQVDRPLVATATSAPLPAFPGAEGFGCETSGGRGGRIVEVTTLDDDGPGSLRAACLLREPRIIVFRVSGTIELKSRIVLRREHSYVTIAGQTAPGDGVQLKGWGLLLSDGVHDAVIRHMRIRPGEPQVPDPAQGGFMVRSENPAAICSRIVIDHCSLYWGPGATTGCANYVENVTWQWCIVQGLVHDFPGQPTSPGWGMALLSEEGKGASIRNISVHHCYLVNSAIGNPAIGAGGPIHLVNNLIYNWGSFGTSLDERGAGSAVNLIGNRYVRGPSSSTSRYAVGFGALHDSDGFIYVRDNLGPFREDSSQPEWAIVGYGVDAATYWTAPAPEKYQRATPWPDSPIALTLSPCEQVPEQVLDGVGACVPARDSLDRQTLEDFRSKRGRIVIGSRQSDEWWPQLPSAPAPADRDHDGMPDDWEASVGLDADDVADAVRDRDRDGYSNVEEYLNSLSPRR
jgi:pectate lyase